MARPKRIHRKHGMWGSPEYKAWQSMRQRCANPRSVSYSDYGGRGISVCPEWAAAFEPFIAHMGRRPSPKHTLDRIDVNGHYEPGNCRWVTMLEQQNNKRGNRLLTWNGETMTTSQWARAKGWSVSALNERLRNGWTVERALGMPMLKKPRGCK